MEGLAVEQFIKENIEYHPSKRFSGFRENLNVIFYQNMFNLYVLYKSTEGNISQTNTLLCRCSLKFELILTNIKQQYTIQEIFYF